MGIFAGKIAADTALGIGGSLLSGIGSLFGSSAASKRQLQAVRETNAQNYKIWGEQKQHNIDMFNLQNQAAIDMWNMQNEYNDPSAQIQRLSAAGLNPYLAIGNGSATGNASSAPAVGTATPATAPQMQAPPSEAFDIGIGQAVDRVFSSLNLMSQTRKNDAETGRIQDLLPYEKSIFGARESNIKADTAYKLRNTKFMDELERGQKLQNDFSEDSFGFRLQQEQWRAANMMAENALLALDKQTKTVLAKYAEPRAILDLASIAQGILVSKATVKEKMAAVRKLTAEAIGQEENNKITIRTSESLIAAILKENAAREAAAGASELQGLLDKKRNQYIWDHDGDIVSAIDGSASFVGRILSGVAPILSGKK